MESRNSSTTRCQVLPCWEECWGGARRSLLGGSALQGVYRVCPSPPPACPPQHRRRLQLRLTTGDVFLLTALAKLGSTLCTYPLLLVKYRLQVGPPSAPKP